MKIIYKIILGMAVLLLPVSCIKENIAPAAEQEQTVVITIGAGVRAAGDASGTPDDYYINSLRVLGYRHSDGTLAFNELALGLPASTLNSDTVEEEIDVKTGRFTIIFIANEHSDPALSAQLGAITEDSNNTLSHLQGLSFAHTAFGMSNNNINIPMVAVRRNIIIQGDNKLIEQGTTYNDKWPVLLERVGIRIGVKLLLTDSQLAAWPSNRRVYFNNVPDKAYIYPGVSNSGSLVADNVKFATLTAAGKEGGLNVFKNDRIILPELSDPALPENKGLTLSVLQGSTPRTGALRNLNASDVPFDWAGTYGYTTPRNHYVDVTASFGETGLDFIVQNLEWNDVVIPWELEGTAVVQREANSYIIPKGIQKPILIPISQVAKGYIAAGLSAPSTANYSANFMWSEMGTAGSTTAISPIVVVKPAGNYIYVQVNSNIEGNFVVEMKNSSGVHLWSWHIWVTDGYFPYTTAAPNSNGAADGDGSGDRWMRYNLGAFNAFADGSPTMTVFDRDKLGIRGLYYQWGRKDPFPMLESATFPTASITSSAEVLSYPRTFATNQGNFRGSLQVTTNNNSWGETGGKTVFDPCPPGYRVPSEAVMFSSSNSEWDLNTLNGRSNPNLGGYYPVTARRQNSSGVFVGTDTGYAWTATSEGTNNAPIMIVTAYTSNNANRSFGHPVRCVAE